MTRITVYRDSNRQISAFEAEGHVGIAEHGNDIACAGVSALIQAAALGCVRFLGLASGIEQQGGYFYFSLPADAEKDIFQKAQAILETMIIGIEEIRKLYPDHIDIAEKIL